MLIYTHHCHSFVAPPGGKGIHVFYEGVSTLSLMEDNHAMWWSFWCIWLSGGILLLMRGFYLHLCLYFIARSQDRIQSAIQDHDCDTFLDMDEIRVLPSR